MSTGNVVAKDRELDGDVEIEVRTVARVEVPVSQDAKTAAAELNEVIKQNGDQGPGSFLRLMREHLGKSETDVAFDLRMSVKQVVALEENAFDNMAAPIYVRSSLRRYAEYLGLSPVIVLDCYERLGAGQPPPLKRVSQWGNVRATGSAPQTQRDSRWLALAFFAMVLVLVFFWWSMALTSKQPGVNMTEADAVRSSQQTTIIAPLAPMSDRVAGGR